MTAKLSIRPFQASEAGRPPALVSSPSINAHRRSNLSQRSSKPRSALNSTLWPSTYTDLRCIYSSTFAKSELASEPNALILSSVAANSALPAITLGFSVKNLRSFDAALRTDFRRSRTFACRRRGAAAWISSVYKRTQSERRQRNPSLKPNSLAISASASTSFRSRALSCAELQYLGSLCVGFRARELKLCLDKIEATGAFTVSVSTWRSERGYQVAETS